MAIIRQHFKKKKAGKPTAKQRELAAQWEATLAAHGRPLEKGKKVAGSLPGAKAKADPIALPTQAKPHKRTNEVVPSLPMSGTATKPVTDEAAQAKKEMRGRVGIAFNKGGLQYLTDSDLAEQKTGGHKRRT